MRSIRPHGPPVKLAGRWRGALAALAAAWSAADAAADLDNNGIVNGADLGILIASWGPCP